jgi:hypothetical protein
MTSPNTSLAESSTILTNRSSIGVLTGGSWSIRITFNAVALLWTTEYYCYQIHFPLDIL